MEILLSTMVIEAGRYEIAEGTIQRECSHCFRTKECMIVHDKKVDGCFYLCLTCFKKKGFPKKKKKNGLFCVSM